MINIAMAVGWKYNNTPGICTREGVLTAWPEVLGPWPTIEEQAYMIAEYMEWVEIMGEITRLEEMVTPRRLREAYSDPTWMNAQEALIATERGKL